MNILKIKKMEHINIIIIILKKIMNKVQIMSRKLINNTICQLIHIRME